MKSALKIMTVLVLVSGMVNAQTYPVTSTYGFPLAGIISPPIDSNSSVTDTQVLVGNSSAPVTCNSTNNFMTAMTTHGIQCTCDGATSTWRMPGTTSTGVVVVGITVVGSIASGNVACNWAL